MLVVVVLVCLAVLAVHPLVSVIAGSLSQESAVRDGQVGLWPVGLTLEPYRELLDDSAFRRAYLRSAGYTALGVTVSVLLTVLLAFVGSRRGLLGRRILVAIVVGTMFVNGGIVPTYVLVSGLGLTNTAWALVLPGAVSAFGFLVAKVWFEQLPRDVEEAALVDGVGWIGLLRRIVLPASRGLVLALLAAVASWNDWFSAFLYLDDRAAFPVTLYARDTLADTASVGAAGEAAAAEHLSLSARAALLVLTMAPMVLLYPVLHRVLRRGAGLPVAQG